MRLPLARTALQRLGRIGIGIELEIENHQLVLEARIVDPADVERIIERIAGDLPEIGMNAHQAAEPGIFELLLPPQSRQLIRLRTDFGGELRTGPCTSNSVP